MAPTSANFKLEVWGAQGGLYDSWQSGFGGYALGDKYFSSNEQIFVVVGGKGENRINGLTPSKGGYNGGGNGGINQFNTTRPTGGAGGGCTHIALLNRGELTNYYNLASRIDHTKEILLVAGGGGGNTAFSLGGAGGGNSGGSAYNENDNNIFSSGGSVSNYYQIGQGEDAPIKKEFNSCGWEGNGGGGGGFYGGKARSGDGTNSDCGGGGGSGYVGDVSNGQTIAGDEAFPSPSGETETGHAGNGWAKIGWKL